MRLAHLILAHNNPAQLARLVRHLSHDDADVYIHLDTKADIHQFEAVNLIPNTFFVKNRVNMVWCEYSTIQGTLNAMEEIMRSGKEYTHINLLSGNDYPLQSADTVHKFLFANNDTSFIAYDKIFNEWSHGQARMNTYYFGDYGFKGRYHVSKVVSKLLPDRKLPRKMVAYGRSQWMTLTSECVVYALKFVKDNPAVERFFKMTWAVDEVFFQTILCNSPLKGKLLNDNLRHIRLNEGYRPVTYTIDNAEELMGSGKLYARKFNEEVDAGILDYLDTHLSIK